MKPDLMPDLISEEGTATPAMGKPLGRWITIAVIGLLTAASGATLLYATRFQVRSPAATQTAATTVELGAVSALGYLQPSGKIIHLSAPVALDGVGVGRVAQLRVQEGAWVKAGQIVAILDNQTSLQADLNLALKQVKVAQAQLAQVQAGAKSGEIAAQTATIASLEAESQGLLAAQAQVITRLEAELSNARVDHQRYQDLLQAGAVTNAQLDSKHLIMVTAQEQVKEAKTHRDRIRSTSERRIQAAQATLNQISEVRPTDIQVAQAMVNQATAQVARAKANLELAYIRAPIDGQILDIYTRSGEVIGDRGIVALGQTKRMMAIAEVYELDVPKVKVGQRATVSSNAFPGQLHGSITQVGLQVNTQGVFSTDPTRDVNRRVVNVKIELDPADSQRVSHLTNMRVNVVIQP